LICLKRVLYCFLVIFECFSGDLGVGIYGVIDLLRFGVALTGVYECT
jgi:hypothetical protein